MPIPLHERPDSFYRSFPRKDADHTVTHYCPGCGHGNIHKYVAEAIDELGIADRVIFINPVGCSVFAYYYLDVGHIQAAHGRAPAVATAVKRARPEAIVICYQGDGDLAAIGGNEILHAANRGENITVIFINNAIYGMTGGQMAPTTLLGQTTTTSPLGRDAATEGYPLKVSELLGSLEAPCRVERVAIGDARRDMAARKAIHRAIRNQVEGKGFSFVEVLSPCPTGWKMSPPDSAKFVLDTMTRTFPLAVVKERRAEPDAERKQVTEAAAARTREMKSIPDILCLTPSSAESTSPTPGALSRGNDLESRFRDPRIKAAGFGGQGVLFLGSLIAEAGMLSGLAVSWLPSYGPEMRGGTAHCHVILSDNEVDSPLVTRASVLFAFNRPSLEKFVSDVIPGGLVIYDSSLIPNAPPMNGLEAIGVPATAIAESLGGGRVANIVALGAYIARTDLISPAAIEQALRSHRLKPETISLNMKALEAGMGFKEA